MQWVDVEALKDCLYVTGGKKDMALPEIDLENLNHFVNVADPQRAFRENKGQNCPKWSINVGS